ncbi:hypothetical protein GWI33_007287 [Rhynchophorus ferrugineus]|uniref:Uncharacterized protein n=1 Tax=Rhynchophorus ferrugineus TaxID=354439 RepID=A0A834MCA0_RHYFE|nr:hypothetical protein GWI33_007287 [Rhynchophorus ferrugineus]
MLQNYAVIRIRLLSPGSPYDPLINNYRNISSCKRSLHGRSKPATKQKSDGPVGSTDRIAPAAVNVAVCTPITSVNIHLFSKQGPPDRPLHSFTVRTALRL